MCRGVPYPFHQDWLVRFEAVTTIDIKQQRLSRQSLPGDRRVFLLPLNPPYWPFFTGSPFSPSPPTNFRVDPFHIKLPQYLKQQQSATLLESTPVFGVTFVVSSANFRPTRFLCAAPFCRIHPSWNPAVLICGSFSSTRA